MSASCSPRRALSDQGGQRRQGDPCGGERRDNPKKNVNYCCATARLDRAEIHRSNDRFNAIASRKAPKALSRSA
jgi:hypothetical protein